MGFFFEFYEKIEVIYVLGYVFDGLCGYFGYKETLSLVYVELWIF